MLGNVIPGAGGVTERASILHVGGVGTNALINSSLLNERGYTSHVASNDLYHFIGSPEWQELGSKGLNREQLGDDFFPNFFQIAESADVRKRWFVQGPQLLTICYLYYFKIGDEAAANTLWRTLQYQRFKAVIGRTTVPGSIRLDEARFTKALKSLAVAPVFRDELTAAFQAELVLKRFAELAAKLNGNIDPALIVGPFEPSYIDAIVAHDDKLADDVRGLRKLGRTITIGLEQPHWMIRSEDTKSGRHVSIASARAAERRNAVAEEDAKIFEGVMPAWSALFALYDQRICYGGAAILGLLSDVQRYMSYEHGTIRAIPFDGTAMGRLTRAAYEQSDAVFLTNTDYATASPRLEFAPEKRIYVPHAFDERPLLAFAETHRPAKRAPGPVRVFGPARQDWILNDPARSKANHLVVEAAAELFASGETGFQVTFVNWGDDTAATKALIKKLGVEAAFRWIEPVSRTSLWKLYLESDAILDQFLLSGLSGVTYESLTLGCRTITKDDGICNKEFFGVAPPFMHAGTATEIAARLRELIADPDDLAGVGDASRAWAEQYHSSSRFVALQEIQFARLAPELDRAKEAVLRNRVTVGRLGWRHLWQRAVSQVQGYAPVLRSNAINSALETVDRRSIK